MATTFEEQRDSRERSGDSVTFRYRLTGTTSDVTALALVKSSSAATYDDLVRDDDAIRLTPTHIDTITGRGEWEVEVRYRPPEDVAKDVGDSTFSFDTGGGTQHITQTKQTVNSYAPAGKTAVPTEGAIGVDRDGQVAGVDITMPVYQFGQIHVIADASVTEAYRGKLFALTGKTNAAPFCGCAAGECLFLGASGQKRGDGDWEITFKFAASPNATGLVVGSITGIVKNGWDYLWARYRQDDKIVAGTQKALVTIPETVYVERVYDEGDFDDLEPTA